jgi:4-alpha-glucanotransferase
MTDRHQVGAALRTLARRFGVQTTWTDTDGRAHRVTDDALTGVLAALGAELTEPTDAPAAVAALDVGAPCVSPVVAVRAAVGRTAPGRPAAAMAPVGGARYAPVGSARWAPAGVARRVLVDVPAALADRRDVEVAIVDEAGVERRAALPTLVVTAAAADAARRSPSAPDGATGRSRSALDGVVGARVTCDLGVLGPLPIGYHRLIISGPTVTADATVIVAPSHCPSVDRTWGVFAPVYALRTDRDWGVGAYPDLAEVADRVAAVVARGRLAPCSHGRRADAPGAAAGDGALHPLLVEPGSPRAEPGSPLVEPGSPMAEPGSPRAEPGSPLVATLPLLAGLLDGPGADASPYRPASRLALAEVYVDVAACPELATSAGGRAALDRLAVSGRLDALRACGDAVPEEAWAAKRPVLAALAADLAAGRCGSDRLARWERWIAERPWVVAYCWFRARRDARWLGAEPGVPGVGALPASLATVLTPGSALAAAPAPTAMAPAAVRTVVRLAAGDVAFATYLYAQWMAEEQLRRAGRLLLDLPVGVHPGGFDPSWDPASFVPAASCGAPPDAFFAAGQHWGLAPLHPIGARRHGHRQLAAAVRTVARFAAVVRIDHVMGLHRMWVVPPGASATDGCYVRYRPDELRAVVALEAHRAGVAVVGEDLGTVPVAVRRAMAADGMLRTAVWQFATRPADPLPPMPAEAVASLGTHDTPPFAAFLQDPDPDRRALLVALGGTLVEALRRCLHHLAAGPARVVIADLADLVLERRPQNRPGIAEGSFRLRHDRTVAQLLADASVAAMLNQVADGRGVAP